MLHAPSTHRLRQHERKQATANPVGVARTPALMTALTALVGCAFVAAVAIGPIVVPPQEVITALLPFGADAGTPHLVVTAIRVPRALVAALVGAALAVAGATMQAIFRNPLADPGVTGVSAGAAAGAVLGIVAGANNLGMWTVPAAAFIGALGAAVIVQIAATVRGGGPATIILVGVAISAFLGALISAAIANSPQDSDLRSVMFWLNGDLVGRSWDHVIVAVGPITVGIALIMLLSRDLNVLTLGEATARTSGIDTTRLCGILLVLAALITASAVAVSGSIGFIGLVVPHMIRLVLGADHRILIPASALLGAAGVLMADLVARMLFDPVVLQTGTVIAFLGSPVFLYLLMHVSRRRPTA